MLSTPSLLGLKEMSPEGLRRQKNSRQKAMVISWDITGHLKRMSARW